MAKEKKDLKLGTQDSDSFGKFDSANGHYKNIKYEVIGTVEIGYWQGNLLKKIDLKVINQGTISKFTFFHANFCDNYKKLQIHVAFGNCLKNDPPVSQRTVTGIIKLDPSKAPDDKKCVATTDCFDVELLAYHYHPTRKKEDRFYKPCNQGSPIQIGEYDLSKCPPVEDLMKLTSEGIEVEPEVQNGNIVVGKN